MSSHVRCIVYGLVSSLDLAGSQAYYLAGCDVPEAGMKAFHCDNCQFEFGDVDTDELVRNREKLNVCSEDWRLFAESQPLTLYGRLAVINLDKFSFCDQLESSFTFDISREKKAYWQRGRNIRDGSPTFLNGIVF
ncbi:hypothetical protein [Lactiplantibacillus pentosus]|uniref:hypothetical protein n=1 Tax=Lactiplantibacillus pentosus TaxID=1589 RepID=UPI0012F86A88|nr:hypothetical protein [Lactiplantibacillus pentosus]